MASAFNAVRVTNNSPHDFTDMYDGQVFTIPASGEAAVPFEAACLWLGDPRKTDESATDPTKRERTDEYHRVQVRCGFFDGKVFDDPDQPEGRRCTWDEARPALAVHTFDGTRVTMVAEGLDAQPQDPSGGVQDEPVESRMRRLEEELVRLRGVGAGATPPTDGDVPVASAELAAHAAESLAKATSSGPPSDTPAKAVSSRGGRTAVVSSE